MPTIEIDGIEHEAHDGEMIIQVADRVGVAIPRFCYHDKLSIVANCRMCLVEVEKAPKPLPACATPIRDGMKVFTKSQLAVDAQKGTMEFLLINHPLDCPICDQGGECELQDLSLVYGSGVSRFHEKKRAVQDQNIGPLISTDMTRCIHCTRCVRFGEEIAGMKELGATGRGEHMEIGTYVERSVDSELSGNVIDLCPVGALTNKPFRFRARAWELIQHGSVAPHDCVGSNLYLHSLRGKVMRVVPRRNEAVNESWLADRDRYSVEGLYAADRLEAPMIKGEDGTWSAVEWETALEAAGRGLRRVAEEHGPEQVGTLVSSGATLEEQYLAAKLTRGLGSANVDHRLRRADFGAQHDDPVFPWLGQSIEALERLDAALLVGSNVRKEQPLIGHRLRKAALRGGRIMFLNPVDYPFLFPVTEKLISAPSQMVDNLAAVVRAAGEQGGSVPEEVRGLTDEATVTDAHRRIAQQLTDADDATVLLGTTAWAHPAFCDLRALAQALCKLTGIRLGYLPEGGNTAGGHLAGALPHRGPAGEPAGSVGLSAAEMLASPRKAYALVGIEPENDCASPGTALDAMKRAEFVVAASPFMSEKMKTYADVVLPTTPFTETAGTFVNVEGRWQSFGGAGRPVGDSRPGWKVLRVLGNQLDLNGFEYTEITEIREEISSQLGDIQPDNQGPIGRAGDRAERTPGIERVGDVAMYSVDALVRRSTPLQETADGQSARQVHLHPQTARKLNVSEHDAVRVRQGAGETVMPVAITEQVPEGCARLCTGPTETSTLGPSFGTVEIEKA